MNRRKEGIYLVAILAALGIGYCWGTIGESEQQQEMSFVNCSPTELGYSCSMHPDVRVTTAGKCPFCQMPLVQEVVLPGRVPDAVVLSEEAAALANLQTTKVGQVAASRTLELVGKITPSHNRIFTQVSSLPGRIEKLYAQRPGQWVTKGEPIARIYSKELISAVEAFRRPNTPESLKLSAQNNLRDWQVSQAVFESLVAAEDYHQAVDIYATASGLVQRLDAHVGEQAVNTIMGAPTTLYTLVDLSEVWVELAVEESLVRYLKIGQEVALSVDAFPEKSFRGKVISLAAAMDETTRTLPVLVSVANAKLELRPGMLARASIRIISEQQDGYPQVPRNAVLWTGKRSVVYIKKVINGVPNYQLKEIQIGEVRDDAYEVIMGLESGEEVVTNGVFTLDAAAQLQGVPSMMNRNPRRL